MVLIVFWGMGMVGQTTINYEDKIELACVHSPECDGIVIQVVSTVIDKTSIECGEFDVEVAFNILEGADCIEDPDIDIYRVRWYTGRNYSVGRSTSVHFSQAGIHTLKLEFRVRTICGQNTKKYLYYNISTSSSCSGCFGAVSYCDLFYNPNPVYNDECSDSYYSGTDILPQISEIWRILFFSSSGFVMIESSNNFGIFTFPYTTRDEDDCPTLKPGLIELIRDLNLFLDLNQTGDPQYDGYSGYATLMDSYGTQCLDGSIDFCKIRINFMDMESIAFIGFHTVDQFEFDLATCSVGKKLGVEDEHCDPRFGYSIECTGFEEGIHQNTIDYSFDDIIEIVNKKFEGNKDDIPLRSIELNKIEYFPTISADYFTIKWGKSLSVNKTCLLINISGEVVKKIENIENTDYVTINIKDLTKGMYIVKVINNITGEISIGKIIKQ